MKNLNLLISCVTQTNEERNILLSVALNKKEGKDVPKICLVSVGSHGKSLLSEIYNEVLGYGLCTSNESLGLNSNTIVVEVSHDNKISDYALDFNKFKEECKKELKLFIGE